MPGGAPVNTGDPELDLVFFEAERRVEGVAVFSTNRVLIDAVGVRQLGGLASELAKQTAEKAQKQQDLVLADAQQLNLDSLYRLEPIGTWPPDEGSPG